MRAVLVFFALLMLSAGVAADEVSLNLDAQTVEQNETLNAVFTYKGQLEGEPGFEVLEKDFQILSRNRRSNLEIVNGNYRYELSWVLTLLPRRTGTVEIPPVVFDQISTAAKSITVTPVAVQDKTDLGDIFLETELTPQDGYVQGQYLFTVRIYFRGWLVDGDLSDPDISAQDVVVQALGDPRRYARFRNGERYQVYERKHALFPQASGTLTIEPTYFSGRLRLPSGRNLLKRITADGISAAVKPSPAGYSGEVWLPAENIEIEEVWPAETLIFEQGVPITRTFIIRATGLSSAQLPQLKFPAADGIRMYPDQPATEDRLVDGGILGVRTESVALVPQTSGELTLPEVSLVWWDTVNNREQTARVASRQVSIAPSASVQQAQLTDTGDGQMLSGESPSARSSSTLRNPWLWATAACALGWLLTLLRQSAGSATAQHRDTGDDRDHQRLRKELRTQLRIACGKNDASLCRQLFDRYAADDHGLKNTMSGEIRALSRQLYGPDAAGDWRGGAQLWERLVKHEKAQSQKASGTKEQLQPL